MDLSTIVMDRKAAREAFLDYRRAVRERHNAEDEQIMRGYRELARGSQLISLNETMRLAGTDERGLPRMAIARATERFCWVRVTEAGEIAFSTDNDFWRARHRNRIRIPQGVVPVGIPRCHSHTWHVDGARHEVRDYRAMVPKIPPALRPAGQLDRFHILWEAEWAKATPPRPPGDPALLRHIGGDLWAVLAIWDLTPLEQAVLAGRSL